MMLMAVASLVASRDDTRDGVHGMNNIKLRDEIFIRVFVGTIEGRMPLGGPRHRLEDNIKMYF
jgi:hypothetical protein